ncbi:MAG: serine hydrolase [Hyphomicrobiales bacterium]|nr:serine hydrolase [Hyphomicrobiales bacterium]
MAGALIALLAMQGAALAVGRHAAMVVDANTGRVLHSFAADEPRFPASLTKVMTLYLVFELIEQGRLSYATRITVSETAAAQPPSKLELSAGSTITVSEAVRALITKSANDVAVAVAEHIAGSEDKFAALMTRKARQIGMRSTVFRNPHGLPDPQQVTTARDMVTLGLRLQDDFPKHYQLFATREFRHDGDTYRNHNSLLSNFEGTDGIKTGYTRASGFNLISSVKRDGRHVVGVVFGGATASARDRTMRGLLSSGLSRAATERTRPHSAIAQARPVPAPRPVMRPAVADVPLAQPAAAQAPRPVWKAEPAAIERPIETARVRPIMIAPSQAPTAPSLQSAPAQQMAANEPRTAPRQPTPVTALSDAAAEPRQPALVAALTPTQPQRGAPPSTLQQQAANLARPEGQLAALRTRSTPAQPQQPTYRLAGPGAAGGVALQVGAYGTPVEAQRQLERTRQTAAAHLASASAETVPAMVNGKQVYRARFMGLAPAAAATACIELRRQQIDCLVARAE